MKKAEKRMKKWHGSIGPYAYFLGVLVAIFAGFMLIPEETALGFLAALGVIVGLLNIDDKELEKFLLAALAFVFCAWSMQSLVQSIQMIGNQLFWVLYYLMAFAAPVATVVSLKVIHQASKV